MLVFRYNMGRELQLSKRLLVVASHVQAGARVIDVGTDHGYIPIYLVQKGIAERVLATDVRPGPLESAMLCQAWALGN